MPEMHHVSNGERRISAPPFPNAATRQSIRTYYSEEASDLRRSESSKSFPKFSHVRKRGRASSLSTGSDDEESPEVQGSVNVVGRSAVGGVNKTDRAVWWLRLSVIATLLSAMATVAGVTFVYVSQDEESNFNNEYSGAVVKVAEAFQLGVDSKLLASKTFSTMYTSHFGGKGATWPNATLPHFHEQAASQLELAEGRALSFNPIITNTTRIQWEAHAVETSSLLDAVAVPQSSDARTISDGIYSWVEGVATYDPGWVPDSPYPDVLVPVWQIDPIEHNEAAVMFNLHAEVNRRRALDDMLTFNVPTLTAILQLVQDTDLRPSSILFYPVRDSFGNSSDANNVVGSVSIVFSWDDVLRSLLPNYIEGLVCVLQSSIGQAYTYFIAGDVVKLIGQGDLHDDKFDSHEFVVRANLKETDALLGTVDHLITYKLFIYPSEDFENEYKTNKPILYTVGAVMIFVCTAGLFLLYDYLVSRRQLRLSHAARRSSQIIDSLFPAAFRDRLFQHQETKNLEMGANNTTSNSIREKTLARRISNSRTQSTRTMKIFLKRSGVRGKPDYNVGANLGSAFAEAPIADLFPETSIMFCDLVGFTAWSAQHEPNEVFQLLEALFWEFDQLADKYGVFKLGTIGDCYIAVTGLPDPMDDHASVLAEFAIQCRKKVDEVRLNVDYLDTTELHMRFGIHSGPVTAGILRGQKSRFELFGDTINTASRMESTSKPDCIQVSSATAELLRLEGMGSWLVARDGPVAVKGKGKMSTFWLLMANEDKDSDKDYDEDNNDDNEEDNDDETDEDNNIEDKDDENDEDNKLINNEDND